MVVNVILWSIHVKDHFPKKILTTHIFLFLVTPFFNLFNISTIILAAIFDLSYFRKKALL